MSKQSQGKRIYQRTYLSFFVLLFVSWIIVEIGLLDRSVIFRDPLLHGLVFAPVVGLNSLAQWLARRHCGLVPVVIVPERRVEMIPRTSTLLPASRVEVRNRDSLGFGLVLLQFFVVGALGSGWSWRQTDFSAFDRCCGFAGMLFFIYLVLYTFVSMFLPTAKLDRRGVHYGWRKVRWSDIAFCEIVSNVGRNGQTLRRWPIFKDSRGRAILSFSQHWASPMSIVGQEEFWKVLYQSLTGSEAVR